MYTYMSFNNHPELVDYLNGAVVGSPLPQLLFDMHNKTLVVHDGSADRTVTFADSTNAGLTPIAILTQIRAAHANLANVTLRNYGHDLKSPVLVLAKAGYSTKAGTANSAVGWPAGTTAVTEITDTNIVQVLMTMAGGPRYDVIVHT